MALKLEDQHIQLQQISNGVYTNHVNLLYF
jgi:hypothetical protein